MIPTNVMLHRDRTVRSTCSSIEVSLLIAFLVIFVASSSSLYLPLGLQTAFVPTHHCRGRIYTRSTRSSSSRTTRTTNNKKARSSPFITGIINNNNNFHHRTMHTNNMSPTKQATESSAEASALTTTTTAAAAAASIASNTSNNNNNNNNWRTIPKPTSSSSAHDDDDYDDDYLKQVDDILRQRRQHCGISTWRKECYQDALHFYQQLVACQDSYVKGPIESALHTLAHAYRLYGPESVVRVCLFFLNICDSGWQCCDCACVRVVLCCVVLYVIGYGVVNLSMVCYWL